MGEFARRFFNTGISCLFLTMIMMHVVRAGLFGFYVHRTKKSPDEIRQLAKGLRISTTPAPGLGWITTYDNASEKTIQEGLAAITYPAIIFNSGVGGFPFVFLVAIELRNLRNAMISNDIGGGLVAGFWLVFVLWRIIKILLLYRVLQAKDSQLQVASID